MLNELEQRVRSLHKDAVIDREWTYDKGSGLVGEVDLRVKYERLTLFYEVKSGHRYQKACEQMDRYRRAFPNERVKGIYIGCNGVRRMY
jgi:hypothetical protein